MADLGFGQAACVAVVCPPCAAASTTAVAAGAWRWHEAARMGPLFPAARPAAPNDAAAPTSAAPAAADQNSGGLTSSAAPETASASADAAPAMECQICFTALTHRDTTAQAGGGTSRGVSLGCNHPICTGCLGTLAAPITAAATGAQQPRPIRCPTCSTRVPVDVLRHALGDATADAAAAALVNAPDEDVYVAQPSQPSAEQLARADAAFLRLAAKLHLKKCPHCGVTIEKNGGCNNMNCYSCKRAFQWNQATPVCKCNRVKINLCCKGSTSPMQLGLCCPGNATRSARARVNAYAAGLAPLALVFYSLYFTTRVLSFPPRAFLARRARKRRRRRAHGGGALRPTMNNIKCVIVGEGNVGKTSLIITAMEGYYPEDFVPSIMDTHSTNFLYNNHGGMYPCDLSIWDTAGQDDYARLRPLSYPQTDVFIVAYDVSRRLSFERVLTTWIPEVRHHMPNTPIILAALKTDLRDNHDVHNGDTPGRNGGFVSTEEGREMAGTIGADGFIEISSRTMVHTQELLNFIPETLHRRYNPRPRRRRGLQRCAPPGCLPWSRRNPIRNPGLLEIPF